MARPLRLALAALSAGLLSTTAGSAFADQASGLSAPEFQGCRVEIGANGMSLPANAPALLVNDLSRNAKATVSAELVSNDGRTPLGAPAPDAHGLLVVTLPTASVGAHTIATKVVCSDKSPESTQETALTLTAPVELPTSVGTLTLRPNASPNGVDRIVLDASPGLRAFRSIAVVELFVDGVRAAGGQRAGFSEELSVQTGRVCVENGALHREKRIVHVTLAAHLAGVADSPAPAAVDIPVDCGAIRWTTDSDFEASSSSEPSSPSEEGSQPSTTAANANGCSAAPHGRMAGGSAVLAAATTLALLAAFRRRRAQTRVPSP